MTLSASSSAGGGLAVMAGLLLAANNQVAGPAAEPPAAIASSYFEGRWAFAEETCDQSSNWTMIAGGNFVSEDLIGTWQWDGTMLLLKLTDLAVDEETGEAGGRFQMEGPVEAALPDGFVFTIAPDKYEMKRCP